MSSECGAAADGGGGERRDPSEKQEPHTVMWGKKTKKRETTPFDSYQNQFLRQRRKITKTKKPRKNTENGLSKNFFLTISKVNFQGKGRKHSQNDTKTKKNKKGSRKISF